MKLIRKNNKKGFTLVELIVVIAIIAILALILIPAITGYVGKADDAALEASARALQTKAVLYISEAEEAIDKSAFQTELNTEAGNKYNVTVSEASADAYSFTVESDKTKKTIEVSNSGIGSIEDPKPATP